MATKYNLVFILFFIHWRYIFLVVFLFVCVRTVLSSNEIGLCCYIFLALSLSLLSKLMQTLKSVSGKKDWSSFFLALITGLLIFRGKKSNISRDFQGQIRGKIARFRGIFVGKKSKFTEKSADFTGFWRKKRQNSQKNGSISRDFSGKKSNFEGFSRGNSQKNRPISREISGGNFAEKQ